MYLAVIKTGGKQYLVNPGQRIKIEKIEAKDGDVFRFDQVLLLGVGDEVTVGTPVVSGARVEARVLRQGRGRKIVVFKYHAKTRYRKKKGHRQPFTELQIEKILP